LNRNNDIYRKTSESPVKTLELYKVERDHIQENMENKNAIEYTRTQRAGEKLEMQSKQITKATKDENVREIEQNKRRKQFMHQMVLEDEKKQIDEHTRKLMKSRER